MSRIIFIASLVCVALVSAFLYGAISFKRNYPPIPQLKIVKQILMGEEEAFDDAWTHLQPARGQGNGVTINTKAGNDDLVLMVGFFDDENQLRLIKRDGSIVRKWSADYTKHFPDPETRVCDLSSPLRVDLHGAHITKLGEVVFNYEYCGTVKLDQCGGVVWALSDKTHHSLVPAEAGGYWVIGRDSWKSDEEPDRFPPFSGAGNPGYILEDTAVRLSENGEILEEFSIPVLMRDNGLEALLTATGYAFTRTSFGNGELVHANKIAELPSDIAGAFPMFAAGDLAISIRDLNLVMVVDPKTRKVKWHQTGPWLRQHDPEFLPDGRISIFNNNVYRNAYDKDKTILDGPHKTNIIAVDPSQGETEVIFGGKPDEEMLSVIRGQHEILPDGAMVIAEFDAGRVLEVDRDRQIVWEYVNAYDEEYVGEITNASVLPEEYFQTEWKTCGNQ